MRKRGIRRIFLAYASGYQVFKQHQFVLAALVITINGRAVRIRLQGPITIDDQLATSERKISGSYGNDTLRLQNDFHGIGLVDVVSELDANSKLSFVSKQVSAPVMTQRVNGRTVATSQVDGVTFQIDLTNRVSGDSRITPLDALQIINFIARSRRPGFGESATASLPVDSIRSTAQAHGLEVPVELATIF